MSGPTGGTVFHLGPPSSTAPHWWVQFHLYLLTSLLYSIITIFKVKVVGTLYFCHWSFEKVLSSQSAAHAHFLPTKCLMSICVSLFLFRFADEFSLLVQLRSPQRDERSVFTMLSPDGHVMLQLRISASAVIFIGTQQRHYEWAHFFIFFFAYFKIKIWSRISYFKELLFMFYRLNFSQNLPMGWLSTSPRGYQ